MLTVSQLLRLKGDRMGEIYAVEPHQTVLEALQLMAKENVGAVLVTENGMLKGIFSERDYARRGAVKGVDCENEPIRKFMTDKVFFIRPEKSLEDCMTLMSRKHIRHLPVMEDGLLVGMITIRDVVNALVNEKENKIRELENYISGGYGGF